MWYDYKTIRQQTETVDWYCLPEFIGGDQITNYVIKYGMYQCDTMQQYNQLTINATNIHVIM